MQSCPEGSCRATGRVNHLTPGQQQAIDEPWIDQASRCSYCGVVFTGYGARSVIRGYYDDPMGKQGWVPSTG